MASNPKARTESATIQNGTQLLIETRRSAKSVWLYFCAKYFLSMTTDSGDFCPQSHQSHIVLDWFWALAKFALQISITMAVLMLPTCRS